MAIDSLKETPDFQHSYFHNLESIFYVMCWIFTLYSGPCSTTRRFSLSKLSYRETAVSKWNGDVSGGADLGVLLALKRDSINDEAIMDTFDQFDDYFDDVKGCLLRFHSLLFKPTGRKIPHMQLLFAKKKAELDRRFDGASPDERERMNTMLSLSTCAHFSSYWILCWLFWKKQWVNFRKTSQARMSRKSAEIGPKQMRDVYENEFLDFAFKNTDDIVEEATCGGTEPSCLHASMECMTSLTRTTRSSIQQL